MLSAIIKKMKREEKVTFRFQMHKDLHDKVIDLSTIFDVNMSDMVNGFIRSHLEDYENSEKESYDKIKEIAETLRALDRKRKDEYMNTIEFQKEMEKHYDILDGNKKDK